MMLRKILITSSTARSLVTFRWHLLQDLVKRGNEVVVCAPFDDKDRDKLLDALNKIGVRLIPTKLNNTGLNPLQDAYAFFKLVASIKKEKPDIVLNYMIKPTIFGSLAAKCAKVPHIYSVITGLGYVFIGESLKVKIIRLVAKMLYRIALKFNTKVFFQNPDDLNLFVNGNLLPKNKTILIHGSGVDIAKYVPTSFPEICTFFMGARLIKDKGIYEYIEAARQVKKRYPGVKFLLAGDIDSNPASITQAELEALVADGTIEYLGWVDDMCKVLARISVFVLPSYREGTPRAVLEAMAAGRPIITTDAPGCRETVKNGVNGCLVAVKNVSQLVAAMERFVLHPELMLRMGRESRHIAEEKYDVCEVNKTILESIEILS